MGEIDYLFLSKVVDVKLIESFSNECPWGVKLKKPFSKYVKVMKNQV